MKNRGEVVKILLNTYMLHPECLDIYITELVNNGKFTMFEIQEFLMGNNLDNCNTFVLVNLYEPLAAHYGLPEPSQFFNREEIIEAHSIYTEKTQNQLPIKFKILAKLREDSYLICQSVKEIMALKEGGLIRWKDNMQRESVITRIGDGFVSHIKFDIDRAKEIGKSMAEGNFFPNALRWHIVTSDCDYSIVGDTFVLKDGYIAEIDGQHRNKGSEYALAENPNIDLNMPVILTVGTPAVAQSIINQDEQRAPIEKSVVDSYRITSGNNVVKEILGSGELDECYKFCDTTQAISSGIGFIVKSELAAAIDKYYFGGKKESKNSELKTAKWLIGFFNELADILQDDFVNYRNAKAANTTKSAIFPGYIYISKALKDIPDWENKLAKVISEIKSDNKLKAETIASAKYLDPIIKEVVGSV